MRRHGTCKGTFSEETNTDGVQTMRMTLMLCLVAMGLGLPGLAAAQDEGLATDIVLEATYRGVHGDGGASDNRWGLGVGVGLPYRNGVDLGIAWGQMFREHGKLHWDARVRMYLSDLRSGLYIGGGVVNNGDRIGYGTLGYQIAFLYGEMDFKSGDDRPVDMIPELGLRFRF